jgi:hypothetical protein
VRGDHTELEQQSETENFSRVLAVTAINGLSDLGFVSDSVSTPLASTDQSAEVVPELSTSDAQGSHLVVPMNDLMSAAVSAGSVIAIAGPSAPRMDCGHTSRAVTPQVESQVRRCTRNCRNLWLPIFNMLLHCYTPGIKYSVWKYSWK